MTFIEFKIKYDAEINIQYNKIDDKMVVYINFKDGFQHVITIDCTIELPVTVEALPSYITEQAEKAWLQHIG